MACFSLKTIGTVLAAGVLCAAAGAQDHSQPEARNMKLVGYSDLQARTDGHRRADGELHALKRTGKNIALRTRTMAAR